MYYAAFIYNHRKKYNFNGSYSLSNYRETATGMIEIINAESGDHLNYTRHLVRQFVHWHRELHRDDEAFTNEYFDAVALEEEFAALPGKYSPPEGSLLLAICNGTPAGCVALRKIDNQTCEMKRMFVYPELHGKGIGSALAKAIMTEAKKIGYKKMRLDTSKKQIEALRLYERLGFKRTNAVYELTETLKTWLVFMELSL